MNWVAQYTFSATGRRLRISNDRDATGRWQIVRQEDSSACGAGLRRRWAEGTCWVGHHLFATRSRAQASAALRDFARKAAQSESMSTIVGRPR